MSSNCICKEDHLRSPCSFSEDLRRILLCTPGGDREPKSEAGIHLHEESYVQPGKQLHEECRCTPPVGRCVLSACLELW